MKRKVIVWEKCIRMSLKCNACEKWMKDYPIKNVNVECTHCKTKQNIDISSEHPEEYNQQTLYLVTNIILNELQENDDVVIQFHPKNEKRARMLIPRFLSFLVLHEDMEDERKVVKYSGKKKFESYKRFKLYKHDKLKFYYEAIKCQ